MLKTKLKGLLWAAVAAVLAVGVVLGALSIHSALNVSAEETYTSTMTVSSGKVTTDELRTRHNMEGNTITAAQASTYLIIENGVLKGWNKANLTKVNEGSLIIIPKEVTSVAAANEDPTDPTTTITFAGNGVYGATDGYGTKAQIVEKLVGVIFEEGSKLTELQSNAFNGCNNLRFCIMAEPKKNADGEYENTIAVGYRAFYACSALRDVVLPEGVTSIGSQAFYQNINLLHISIPSTCTNIASNAFTRSWGLTDIEYSGETKPTLTLSSTAMSFYQAPTSGDAASYKNKSYLYTTNDPVNRYVFNYLASNSNIVLATISSHNATYNAGWYFIGFTGTENKNPEGRLITYELPQEIDLTAARSNIEYDFLNCQGQKVKNTFTGSDPVTSYNINSAACESTFFSRIVIPDSVKVIGNYAFQDSHVMCADIGKGVTHIGAHAFRGVSATNGRRTNNVFYIRKPAGQNLYVGMGAFAMSNAWGHNNTSSKPSGQSGNYSRLFIFSDSKAYDEEGVSTASSNSITKYNSAGDSGLSYSYLVPVNMVEYDAATGASREVFYENRLNDYSYRDLPPIATGDDYGNWVWADQGSSSRIKLPALEGYSNTVWYTDTAFGQKITLGASSDDEVNIDSVEKTTDSKGRMAINLYTKKLVAPTFTAKEYTYGEFEASDASYNAAFALSDTDDFRAEFKNFINPVGNGYSESAALYPRLNDAGTYTVRFQPNASKWGTWTAETADNYTATIVVKQKEIDLGKIENLPVWSARGSELGGGTEGDGVIIYQYMEDNNWYLNPQLGLTLIAQAGPMLNGYVRATGDDVIISAVLPASANYKQGSISGNIRRGELGTGTQQVTLNLETNSVNYIFTNDSAEENQAEFGKRGTSINVPDGRSSAAVIFKTWYVVTVGNWLMPSETPENPNPSKDDKYDLVTLDSKAVTSWTYEDPILTHIPQAANNAVGGSPVSFTLTYETDGTVIESAALSKMENGAYAVEHLPKFINAAMPAGTYVVHFMAKGGVGEDDVDYPDIDEQVRLTVNSRVLPTSAVETKLTEKSFSTFTTNETNPVLNNVFLFPDGTIDNEMTVINGGLHLVHQNGDANASATESVWSQAQYAKYYDEAKVTYNLDSLATSGYLTKAQLDVLDSSRVPKRVGEYRVYYSVSAPSYVTLGGLGVGDTDRRNYYFDTTINLRLSLANPVPARISSYTMSYTGRDARPTVTYSPYFSYNFPDANYVHARKNCTVTLTIAEENANLYYWNTEALPANGRVSVNGNVATIRFDIESISNDWATQPQLSGWTYNGFDGSVYRINAVPSYNSIENVYFRIGTRLEDGTFSWISLVDAKGVNQGVEFTIGGKKENNFFQVNEQGEVSEAIANILNLLDAGEYYLGSWIAGIQSQTSSLYNVEPFATAEANYPKVTVLKLQNRWLQSPKIVSWTWDNYVDSKNVITATAANTYGGTIYYTILNSDKKLINSTLTQFALAANGRVPAAVSAAFRQLGAGNYYLLASLDGTVSLIGLNEIPVALKDSNGNLIENPDVDFTSASFDPIPFEILVANGRFDKTPAVINWTYSQFSAGTNFVAATASYGESYGTKTNIPVLYSLYTDATLSTAKWTAKSEANAKTELAALSAGTYYLYVYTNRSAALAKNVTIAESTIQFTVSELTNSWSVAPALSGWTYGSPNTFTRPIPAQGTVTYTLNGTSVAFENLNAELANLGANAEGTEYTLVVSVAGESGKYTPLSQTLTFKVSRDNFGWVTEPSVTSITWNNNVTKITVSNGTLNSKWNSANDAKIVRRFYKTVWDASKSEYTWDSTQPLAAAPEDAGTYVYVTLITNDVDTNYNELRHTAFFEIRQASNQWTGTGTQNGSITQKSLNWYWSQPDFTPMGAQYGTVTFTIGGGTYTAENLGTALAGLPAGTHSLVCSVPTPASGNYAGLTDTITITVKKSENDWKSGKTLGLVSSYVWNTSTDLQWRTPEPELGSVVAITVATSGTNGTTLFYIELNLDSAAGLQGAVESLLIRLRGLDVGTYKMTATVAESENYKGCTDSLTFTVNKAPNGWRVAPALSSTQWGYNGYGNTPVGTPSATPNYGEEALTILYYLRAENGTRTLIGSTMPTNAGNYSVGFSVVASDTDNYEGITGEKEVFIDFIITKAKNESFSINPYVVGWDWNDYRKDVNLFGAVPTTGGKVTFAVKQNGQIVNGLSGIEVDENNVIIDDADNTIANKLNALARGTYSLVVSIGEVANYQSFESTAVLTVGQANNVWTTQPNIVRWSEYYFKAAVNTPKAVSLYGDVTIEVRGRDDDKLYYRSVGGVEEVTLLGTAMGGWYKFTANVAEHNNYRPLDYEIEFQVFTESSDMPNNYWIVVPSIDSWIAGSPASVPALESLRGEELVSYSKAELKDGKYVAVGEPTTVQPEAPGKYFLHARIRHEAYPQDELLKLDVMFEIFERTNEWTVAPSIQSYALGDGPSTPVADILYKEDSVIDIKYKLKYSDDEPTAQLPTTPGEYVMIVKATAKYCTPLEAQIEFTVSLSQNSWVSAPTIKDWSEEFDPNNPFGEAAVGSEHIVYTYARADKPDEILTEKPTTEGSYILYATLAMDGYETLTAEYAFTISSPYDDALLLIDIILATVGCAFAVAVIYFAIKRYKQN